MTFVPPSWWMIGLTKIGYILIPLIIGILLILTGLVKEKIVLISIGVIIVIAGFGLASMTWHNNYEVASVDEANSVSFEAIRVLLLSSTN